MRNGFSPKIFASGAREQRWLSGFTLLELLVVMGVLTVMAAVAVPAFARIASSRNVQKGIYEVEGILRLARSEAITRQTYVWVGFDNAQAGGRSELRVAAVYSRDGSASPATANLTSLVPLTKVAGVALSDWSSLKAETRALWTESRPASVSDNAASATFPAGAHTMDRSLTFSPRGEVLLASQPGLDTPYDAWIDVSFREVQGTAPLPAADDAALVVEGGTGGIRRIRLP